MLTWDQYRPHFENAVRELDKSLDSAIVICDLFEKLTTEIAKVAGNDGLDSQNFVLETQRHMQTLEGMSYIVDKENVPLEAVECSSVLFLKTQYVVSVVARLESLLSIASMEPRPANAIVH